MPRRLLYVFGILSLAAVLFFAFPSLSNAEYSCTTPNTNCSRDSDCEGVGGWCQNRICKCGSPAPAVCSDRCDALPSCAPGVSTCGGHNVVSTYPNPGDTAHTVHVTDCRGINTGSRGGVISYCSQSVPTPTPAPVQTSTPPPAPTLNLSSTPASVAYKGTSSLTWSSSGASSCNASGGTTGWAGFKPLSGTFSASNLISSSVYTLTCTGPGGSVTKNASVSVSSPTPTAISTPSPTATPIGDGRIVGRCVGWPNPHVEIRWSANPPAGSLPSSVNSIVRTDDGIDGWFFGGGYPGVDGKTIGGTAVSAWSNLGYPDPNFAVNDLRDDTVAAGHVYEYRVKYRPEVSSSDVYSVFVESGNCGGPPSTPMPLSISPQSLTTDPNISAVLRASGGMGTYVWSAPGGMISGIGPQVAVVFGNGSTDPAQRTVTVTSGSQSATAAVTVNGLVTFRDDIDLNGQRNRFVLINDDSPYTDTAQVSVALGHGFSDIATSSVSVKLANTMGGLENAGAVPFQKSLPWDICSGLLSCSEGLYTIFAIFVGDAGQQSPIVMDNITYLKNAASPSVEINNNDTSTAARIAVLKMQHGFDSVPDDQVMMQIANRSDAIDHTAMVPFVATLSDWDLCGGAGSVCVNGVKTVFARFCSGQTCSDIVQDSIDYQSIWPDWGVRIDGDAPVTESNLVRLHLNPWFNKPGTTVLISNSPDLSDASPISYSDLVLWDICYGRAGACGQADYVVYVKYLNDEWGDAGPDRYSDDITYSGCLNDLCPTPEVLPSPTSNPSPRPTTPGTPGPQPTGVGTTPEITESPRPSPTPLISGFASASAQLLSASNVIGPVSLASAAVVAASAAVATIPLLGPGLGSFVYQWFMGALGILPRRKNVWGTVYDANTKRPIPFAKVQLLDRNRRVLETRVADKDGRYGFLTTPESLLAQNVQIYIAPSHAGYVFPAKTPVSIDTLVYNNLYYGDLIQVSDKALINFDIPMDPVRISAVPLALKSPSIVLGASVAALADAGFWLGLVMVPLNFVLHPDPFSFGTMCLFLGTASLRLFGLSEHPFGSIKDSQTGHAMAFALITLNDMSGKRVGFAVTDEQGRYFMVVEKGTYEMTVFTPATIQPSRQVKMTVQAKKGWITRSLSL